MKKQELIERIEGLKNIFGNKCEYVKIDFVIELASELDELEAGHADEAPRYVKNILARLRELPLHDREVWLKTIMGEFEQDFSRAKWREGYEQGKLEGSMVPYEEPQKVTIPQFVAGWIEKIKGKGEPLYYALDHTPPEEVDLWFCEDEVNRQNIFARAWLDGYTVEEEKRYLVKMKGISVDSDYLNYDSIDDEWYLASDINSCNVRTHHTRKELEDAGFGWVFDCEGIEIEEVEG